MAGSVLAVTSTGNSQANNPQVAGDPAFNATAIFPTNKQNEPTIAQNPVASQFLIAGANDEQRQPPCGPGPIRGFGAPASDCSFFPGIGTSGVYTSNDGGLNWVNRGLLDDQASWQGVEVLSDGDPGDRVRTQAQRTRRIHLCQWGAGLLLDVGDRDRSEGLRVRRCERTRQGAG